MYMYVGIFSPFPPPPPTTTTPTSPTSPPPPASARHGPRHDVSESEEGNDVLGAAVVQQVLRGDDAFVFSRALIFDPQRWVPYCVL